MRAVLCLSLAEQPGGVLGVTRGLGRGRRRNEARGVLLARLRRTVESVGVASRVTAIDRPQGCRNRRSAGTQLSAERIATRTASNDDTGVGPPPVGRFGAPMGLTPAGSGAEGEIDAQSGGSDRPPADSLAAIVRLDATIPLQRGSRSARARTANARGEK
jgi:hypothetical protein